MKICTVRTLNIQVFYICYPCMKVHTLLLSLPREKKKKKGCHSLNGKVWKNAHTHTLIPNEDTRQ